jgi:small subunit ribosomal protein S8
MNNDTIANMITCIRNANLKKTKTVQVPATNITQNIGKILLQEGFIESFREHQENKSYFLVFNLKYQGKKKKTLYHNFTTY